MSASDDLNRLRNLASSVKGAYPDFVNAVVNGGKRHGVVGELTSFIEDNPGVLTDEVLEYYYSTALIR